MRKKKQATKKLKYKETKHRNEIFTPIRNKLNGWNIVFPKVNLIEVSPDKYNDLMDCQKIVIEIATNNISEDIVDRCKEVYVRDFIRKL